MSYLPFKSRYDRFPVIDVEQLHIQDTISDILQTMKGLTNGVICFETYPGVDLTKLREEILEHLPYDDIIFIEDIAKPEEEYDKVVDPYLYDDRVFGYYSHQRIEDFYQMDQVARLNQLIDHQKRTIVFGFGASLIDYDHLIFVGLTRWEIQLRYRKGLSNFRKNNPEEDILKKYKRGYFVEWRVADRIKEDHWDSAQFLLDTTIQSQPKLVSMTDYNRCLDQAVSQPFRVVPYFDPGVWGGQWMKEVCNLDPEPENYAWCFDGVPEENSIRFQSNGKYIETPSQDIVQFRPLEFMGSHVFEQFGHHFPIRFDLLDTFEGGNLSLQVHPVESYIKKTFGMTYTQDESYYILDALPGAVCYLGVKKDIDQEALKQDLIDANQGKKPFDDSLYINQIPVKKHDHLLIPGGTIHCSGKNTLVLEISSCVYIFTFKLWDWGRVGMDGLPRPVSLEHGFQNIQYDRDTDFVYRELVNHIEPISDVEEKTGLHELEFIESRRYYVKQSLVMETNSTVNVCNLVDGIAMRVESLDKSFRPFEVHYAETFYIPANIKHVRFVPLDPNGCIVVKAMVR